MPILGGIGVNEAAIALVVRLLTFYLPSIWGGFAMRWLRRQAYL